MKTQSPDKHLAALMTVEMTYLSNERTFLTYLRTFMVLLSSGVALVKWEVLSKYEKVGYVFIVLSFITLAIGIYRFFAERRHIKYLEKHYREIQTL